MISGKEIKVLDSNAEFYGVPNKTLMENAGEGIADFIKKRFKPTNLEIIFFCGLGNNGGDGFVAARYLSKNYKVNVFLIGKKNEIKTEISKTNFKKIEKTKVKIYYIDSINKIDDILGESDIIVDAMLGIGLSGSLRNPYPEIVNKINKTKNKKVISVDIATGFGTDFKIIPDYTITFHDKKFGMNKRNSGEIKIVDIGIPKKAIDFIGPGELKTYYPIPKKESHKGENGRILIVGGGPYIGAPALSGFASLRTGADLVYITSPQKVARAITSYSPLLIKPIKLAKKLAAISPNLIVNELNGYENLTFDDIKIIKKLILKVDCCVIGPGLGFEKETKEVVEQIINICNNNNKPMVIDADAIQVVGNKPDLIKDTPTVITPHAGEFKELTGTVLKGKIENRKKTVEYWADKLNVTIFLKGSIDIISNGKYTKLNDIHNQSMTVGGTGDVLAGIVGCLLSKKVEPFNAARVGAYLNGAAGNLALNKHSYGLIATDIIEEISNVLIKYL